MTEPTIDYYKIDHLYKLSIFTSGRDNYHDYIVTPDVINILNNSIVFRVLKRYDNMVSKKIVVYMDKEFKHPKLITDDENLIKLELI